MARVQIGLLGGFSATVDGAPVDERSWRLRKARDLVKLLALAPERRLHREQAMDALWPERSPGSAANNLYQAVHAARRALGQDAIAVRDELLFLDAEVDVARAEQAAAEARRAGTGAAHRAALALLDGELLPENRYDDWAIERREELESLRAELLAELEQAGSSDGLRGLPGDTSSFVGREHELADLRALLARTRLLTLTGAGGVGKTRLALELARAAEPAYADGAALVELAVAADADGVLDAVATALDVRALPGRTLTDAVTDFAAGRECLLVVDNCEHVLAAAGELVGRLLRTAARLTVVATSREPLGVAGEVVFRVPSLAIPDPEQSRAVAELLLYESVRLFAERAEAAAGFALDEENAAAAARICFRLDGLPLALELAAGRVAALGVETIAERLDDRFRLLRAAGGAAPTRQQTLAATLQWSHDLLDPLERILFRRLAVFAGSFDLPAVEAVGAGDGIESPDVADLLARLADKSLVTAEAPRYRLLETVRLYARDRLDEAGEGDAVAARHAQWALALAERLRGSVALDADSANLRAALETLVREAPTDALRLCVELAPFWMRRIDLREANRQFTAALAAAPGPTSLRAEALLSAAKLDMRGGEHARGHPRAEESLDVARRVDDSVATWRALQFLAEDEITYGPIDRAAPWIEQGLAHAREHGFRAAEALVVYTEGVARWLVRQPGAESLLAESASMFAALEDPAERIPAPLNIGEMRTGLRAVLEETLQPFFDVTCEEALAYVLANQAAVARVRGEPELARSLFDESAARFGSDERGRAHVLVRRGHLELATGEVETARECFEEALALRRGLNDRRAIGLTLGGLALAEIAAGAFGRADALIAEATELFRRAADRWGLVNTLWRRAELALARQDPEAAEATLLEALAVLESTVYHRWVGHGLAALAEVTALKGDTRRATELLEEAAGCYAGRGDTVGVAAVRERAKTLQS
jgi:predicted ATPase